MPRRPGRWHFTVTVTVTSPLGLVIVAVTIILLALPWVIGVVVVVKAAVTSLG